MQKYKFTRTIYENNWIERKCCKENIIAYKCLICNCFMKEYDDTWTDAKKAEVQAEADAHHAEHLNISS